MSMLSNVAEEPVHLRAAGTLWLPQFSTLVVADLHLEKGSAYAVGGQLLPPYDTRDTLERLATEIRALNPQRLVLLGDSLHDMDAVSRVARDDADAIRQLAQSLELVWISGNHDPDGGAAFGGQSIETLNLGRLKLCHEPKPVQVFGEIAGHLHPCAKLRGSGVTIRRRCFITDGQRLILPAFGSYTGGLNVRDEAFSDLFSSQPDVFLTGRKITRLKFEQLSPDRDHTIKRHRLLQ